MNERASHSFRLGYRDAMNGKPCVPGCCDGPYHPGTFGFYDYTEGHRAASAELKWDRIRSERNAAQRSI